MISPSLSHVIYLKKLGTSINFMVLLWLKHVNIDLCELFVLDVILLRIVRIQPIHYIPNDFTVGSYDI